MKAHKLQAQFIRKREIQQAKIEKTNDVQRYYDKWGKITTHFEHWTTPEYYQEAEEKIRKRLQEEERQTQLAQRQARLKAQLRDEKLQIDNEMNNKQRPRSRQATNDILDSVRQTLSNADEYKKRADLESTLYSRWRLGFDQEKILKESKNNHHAMAKLSWLDRQLESQMENEKKIQENNIIELKLQEEKRKHEAFVTSCTQLRDSEINQFKKLQADHIQELKMREREAHDAKLEESTLRKKLGEIQKEIENINSMNNKRRDRVHALHNFRRIKMIMRERSEAVKRDLQQDLSLLDRISFDPEFDNNEEIGYLRQKFQGQHDVEAQHLRHIESMYESEAKEALKKQEEKWNDDAVLRERQLKLLMEDRIQTISDRINDCVRRQQDLNGLRGTHLKSVDDCNQRLKELMNSSLNNDVEIMSPSSNSKSSTQAINGMIRSTEHLKINGLAAPKFGRKKVAWS